MTDPSNNIPPAETAGATPSKPKQPSLGIGLGLLGLAAVLIVIVLIQPTMSGGLKITIAVLAVAVVCALFGYAFTLWKSTQKGGRTK